MIYLVEETVNLDRDLDLRLDKIYLPFLVDILERKPCIRFLFNKDG